MAITALPTPPSRQDSANFAVRADAFLTALPTFATEANALATEVNGYATSSSTNAGNALTYRNEALTARDAAAASANAAATSYDNFDDRYLGPKAANPTTDNDNQTLLVGALYWNTASNEMRVWNGTAWVAVQTTSAATQAAASATAAAGSASSASTSATNAAHSATAAATSYDNFDDRYLGSKSEDPAKDNDNDNLLVGALYWNTLAGEMRVWNSTAWVAVQTTSAATNAAASATAAANSASSASTSATNAANSATAAANSATTASNSASSASTSATAATNSATAAANSATAAANSATAAANSATNAADSATSASASATAAANSASSASTSATNAATSASAASTSASSAADSAASAAASWDSFDDRYLGSKTSDPTVDNDDNPLLTGTLYWNSTTNKMRVRTSSDTWVDAQPTVAVTSFNGRTDAVALTKTDVENALSGGFSITGTITATDFNSSSDHTLKTNIQPLVGAPQGYDSLVPVSFDWKDSGKKSYGLIAQDLELIFPELVTTNSDGIKSVNYIPLIAMLLAKVQELTKRVQHLENT